MKQILIILLMLIFLPFVLLALWYVLKTPGMLSTEEDYPILASSTKGQTP